MTKYTTACSGIFPLIDLGNFHIFADTAKNIVLNKVQIVTDPTEIPNTTATKTHYYITK